MLAQGFMARLLRAVEISICVAGFLPAAAHSYHGLSQRIPPVWRTQSALPSNGESEYPDYLSAVDLAELHSNTCGPMSLLVAMRVLGISVPTQDLRQIVATSSGGGSSLGDLNGIAEEYGLQTVCVECSLDTLWDLGMCGVIATQNHHFVAMTGFAAKGLQLVDFPYPPRILDLSKGIGKEVRKALLVTDSVDQRDAVLRYCESRGTVSLPQPLKASSDTAVSALPGPLVPHEIDIGTVVGRWSGTVHVTNQSEVAFPTAGIRSSCQCVRADVQPSTIPPGQTAVVSLTVGPEARYGPFAYTLFLGCKDDRSRDSVLRVYGSRKRVLTFQPPVVTMSGVAAGAAASTTVYVRSAVPLDQIEARVPLSAPLSVSFVAEDGHGGRMLVQWRGGDPGWHRYPVEMLRKGGGEPLCPPVHVAVGVAAPACALPGAVSFPRSGGQRTIARCVRIVPSAIGNRVSRAYFAERDAVDAFQITVSAGQGNTSLVRIEPQREAVLLSLKKWSFDLTIELTDGSSISVPVMISPDWMS